MFLESTHTVLITQESFDDTRLVRRRQIGGATRLVCQFNDRKATRVLIRKFWHSVAFSDT